MNFTINSPMIPDKLKKISFSYPHEELSLFSQINCHVFGVSPETCSHFVVALHGYSDSAIQFSYLNPFFEARGWCVVAPELPFHGDTIWRKPTFSREDLIYIVEKSLASVAILGGGHFFSLLGFSYGCRLSLCLNGSFGERLRDVWLVAPEGISSPWMRLANNIPNCLKQSFINRLEKPERLLRFTEQLYKKGLLPRFVHSFSRFHLSNAERRARLFVYWLSTDDFLLLDLEARLSAVSMRLFIGEKDDMFPLKNIEKKISNKPNISYYVIADERHQLLNERFCHYLLQEHMGS